jgi:hypothetical protein
MNSADIVHPRLGLLRYNNKYDCYEGQITLQQVSISFSFVKDDESEIELILDSINRFVDHLGIYTENAKNYAVEKLLELKNETWLDEDEEPLTPEQFKIRMILESIDISSKGDVAFFYNDGDLFFGHCILIKMDSNNRFIDSEIAG